MTKQDKKDILVKVFNAKDLFFVNQKQDLYVKISVPESKY